MFEIHVKDPNVDAGMLRVDWRVDRALLERLAKLKIRSPMVLIVAAPLGDRYDPALETRRLAAITDGFAYVDFRTNGPHRVHAMVVFKEAVLGRDLVNEFLSFRFGSWDSTILASDGNQFRARFDEKFAPDTEVYCFGIVRDSASMDSADPANPVPDASQTRAARSQCDVEVCVDMFAKLPNAWEAAWVNHWHRHPPVDECDYDKRRLWAYSVQPFVMLVGWLLRLGGALFFLLAGFKRVNWQPVLHPLSSSIFDEFVPQAKENYFWPASWGKNPFGFVARFALPVFSPLSLLVIGGWSFHVSGGNWALFLTTFGVALAKAVSLVLAGTVAVMVIFILLAVITSIPEAVFSRKKRVPVADNYLAAETVAYLADDAGRPGALGVLVRNGPSRRTIRLVYQATKAAVCKPFPRR